MFRGAASRPLASGYDIKAHRPRMPTGHPAGPTSTAGLGFPSGAPAASQPLGASSPKPKDGAISCINPNIQLLLGEGRCGHTSGPPREPLCGSGRQRPGPYSPSPLRSALSPLWAVQASRSPGRSRSASAYPSSTLLQPSSQRGFC